jgi:hypothetical protein
MLANQEQNQEPTLILTGMDEQYGGNDALLLENVSKALVKDRAPAQRFEKACSFPASAILKSKPVEPEPSYAEAKQMANGLAKKFWQLHGEKTAHFKSMSGDWVKLVFDAWADSNLSHSEFEKLMAWSLKENAYSAKYLTLAMDPMKTFCKNVPSLMLHREAAVASKRALARSCYKHATCSICEDAEAAYSDGGWCRDCETLFEYVHYKLMPVALKLGLVRRNDKGMWWVTEELPTIHQQKPRAYLRNPVVEDVAEGLSHLLAPVTMASLFRGGAS